MNTSWFERLIIWFWGIRGVYDEHARAEFGRAATVGVTLLLAMELVYSEFMIAFPHALGEWWPIVNLLMLVVVLAYVGSALKKSGLNVVEVTQAEYQGELIKLRKRVGILVVFLAVVEAVTMAATTYAQDGRVSVMNTLLPVIIFIIVYTPLAYAREKAAIHIVQDD